MYFFTLIFYIKNYYFNRILTVLISRAGRPQKRDDLIDECWVEMPDGKDTSNHDQRRNVDVQIKKIRAKLKEIREDPNPKDVIQTHTEIDSFL